MPLVVMGAIAAGSAIASAVVNSNAAGTAASEQEKAQQQVFNTEAAATQGAQANLGAQVGIANSDLGAASQLFNPYVQTGQNATNSIQNLINGPSSPLNTPFSFNQSDLQNSPGYQFTLAQGQQAIQRAAAAQGGLFSSGTLKSLAGYTTGTAEQYFNDAYNQALGTYSTNTNTALQKINSLQQLANLGYGGTTAQANLAGQQAQNSITGAQLGGQFGMQGAGIEAGALTAQGNAAAAGTIGQANAVTGAIGGFANNVNSAISINSLQNLLQSLNLGTGGSVPPPGTAGTPNALNSTPPASDAYNGPTATGSNGNVLNDSLTTNPLVYNPAGGSGGVGIQDWG